MTCIVGITDGHTVYMGADSAGVDGAYRLQVRIDKKIFTNGEFLIGCTTSFRMIQLLRYALKPPKPKEGQDIEEFMVVDMIDAIRKTLKDGGFAKKEDEVERGGNFLVGYRGHLFEIQGDYQVAETVAGYAATGCGIDLALGSMFSTNATRMKPEARIRQALEAAAHHSAGVSGPFWIMKNPE